MQTVAALKASNAQLKQTLKQDLDVDAVEDLTDDMADLMEDFNEINDALGRNFATPDDLDEADLDAELELLEDELEDEADVLADDTATPSYLQASNLPAVPGSALPSAPADDHALPAMPNRT